MIGIEENTKDIKVSKRPYIVFGVMFGGFPLLLLLVGFFIQGAIAISYTDLTLVPFYIMLFIAYFWLFICKVSYNNSFIWYRGLFGTKTIKIADIKKYQIKTETHSNPFKPMFGLFIDTVNKKSKIIIPVNIFSPNDINDLLEHIDTTSKSPKGRTIGVYHSLSKR